MAEVFLTKAGYEKLIKDLALLKNQETQLHQEMVEAQENKDSTEHVAAKERLDDVLNHIVHIQDKLQHAKFFEETDMPADAVALGCTVTIRDNAGEELAYTVVTADESDPAEGRLSIGAPIAQALLGKKVGDQVEVNLPAGSRLLLTVLKIGPTR